MKLAKFASRLSGPATVAGMGVSISKIASGEGNGLGWADLAVNSIGLATPYIVSAFALSNPVGWIIGGAVLAYNGYRLYQDFNED